jgi:hypothetical protein
MKSVQPEQSERGLGTWDEQGAGDHDQPYQFGFRPRVENPFPFNTRQYARLLVLRSRLRETDTEWST